MSNNHLVVHSPSVWRAMEMQAKTRHQWTSKAWTSRQSRAVEQQLKRIDSIVIACLILEVVVFLIIY